MLLLLVECGVCAGAAGGCAPPKPLLHLAKKSSPLHESASHTKALSLANTMSTPEKQAPKADNDADEAAAANGVDDNHEEAAEILTDLVQNQMSISSGDATQIAEAQTTALQQLLQQGGASASKQQAVQALLDAAMKGDASVQQQLMGQVSGEKKQHAFWDTQVSLHIMWTLYIA